MPCGVRLGWWQGRPWVLGEAEAWLWETSAGREGPGATGVEPPPQAWKSRRAVIAQLLWAGL